MAQPDPRRRLNCGATSWRGHWSLSATRQPPCFAALRSSPREARARLGTLKREFKVTLQEHAAEVQRLVGIAYGDLNEAHRTRMALESFSNTLNNSYLQRHLLAVQPGTIADAVRAGNEYLQVRTASQGGDCRGTGGAAVRMVDEEDQVDRIQAGSGSTDAVLAKALATLTQQLAELQQRLDQPFQHRLQAPARPAAPVGYPVQHRQTSARPALPVSQQQAGGGPGCWGCGGSGHLRRDCPVRPWQSAPQARPMPAAGNGQGSRQ